MKEWLLAPGRLKVTSQENIFHECLAAFEMGRVSAFSLESCIVLERGEEPDACAAKELREETGYKAESMERLLSCYMAPGYSNEVIHLYVATGLEKGKKEMEEDEEIAVEAVGFDETLRMIEENEIEDAKTIVGVLSYLTRG